MALQAIKTKYLPATNTKGSRIKATAAGGETITIPFPQDMDTEAAHREAAHRLMEKLDWRGFISTGATKDGYVHVMQSFLSLPLEEIKRGVAAEKKHRGGRLF